jgi:hypothetical protein
LLAIGGAANGTEGGGSEYALGIGTVLQGVSPTPPGFNFLNYDLYYTADRLNNSRGDKAVPRFHVDVMVSSLRGDYSLAEPIAGIRFGAYFLLPFYSGGVVNGKRARQDPQRKGRAR